MTVLDSVQVVESGLQVVDWLDSLSVELGFWIPIVSRILGSLGLGFRIPQKKIPGFWNPDTLTWGDFLCEVLTLRK